MTRALSARILVCAILAAPAVASGQHHDEEGLAADEHHAEAMADPAEQLSPKLRGLLNKEMTLIDNGMGELATAISQGEWERVEEIAGKIRDSFILQLCEDI